MSTESTHVRRALGEILTALRALSGVVSQCAPLEIPEHDSLRRDKFMLTAALAEIEEQIDNLEPRTENPAPRPAYPTVDDLVDLLKLLEGYGVSDKTRAKRILDKFPPLPSPNTILNVVAGANTLPEKVTRIFALFAGEANPAPGPRTTTPDSLDRQVSLLAHDVYRSVLESREHDLAAAELNHRKTTHMHSTEIVEYARKAAAIAARDTVVKWRDALKTDLSPLSLDGKAEDQDQHAGTLQLRRDVKWLEDRDVRGQVSLLPHTLAEMVGLDVTEFLTLTLKTRQKFENRAYTALRTLNSGAKK